jgi:hypothetical protein
MFLAMDETHVELAMREAAFGTRPDLAITAFPRRPVPQWLAAVALGGQGRYAAAATVLTALLRDADPVLAALAASTLASHRRQLGGHRAARALDAMALGRLASAGQHAGDPAASEDPDGVDARGAWSDAVLGLAADALGIGRVAEARRLLAAAAALGAPGWRGAIRLGWVSAEIELGVGRADLAVRYAEAAAGLAAATDSVRHQVKSALVLGAALAAGGRGAGVPQDTERNRARSVLTDARQEAATLGLLPLGWPCALLLAELEPESARQYRRDAGTILHCLLRRADPIGRAVARSSSWVPDPAGLIG